MMTQKNNDQQAGQQNIFSFEMAAPEDELPLASSSTTAADEYLQKLLKRKTLLDHVWFGFKFTCLFLSLVCSQLQMDHCARHTLFITRTVMLQKFCQMTESELDKQAITSSSTSHDCVASVPSSLRPETRPPPWGHRDGLGKKPRARGPLVILLDLDPCLRTQT